MALLFTIISTLLGAMINTTAFSSVSLGFSILRKDGWKERKRHDLAQEKLQKARDKWNEDRMEQLSFINKILRGKNEGRAYINNPDEEMLEYYRVFAKKNKVFAARVSIIRFLSRFGGTKKWCTIICYGWYRHCNICSIQIP